MVTVLDFNAARREKLEREYEKKRWGVSHEILNPVVYPGERVIDAISRILDREMPKLREYRKQLKGQG